MRDLVALYRTARRSLREAALATLFVPISSAALTIRMLIGVRGVHVHHAPVVWFLVCAPGCAAALAGTRATTRVDETLGAMKRSLERWRSKW